MDIAPLPESSARLLPALSNWAPPLLGVYIPRQRHTSALRYVSGVREIYPLACARISRGYIVTKTVAVMRRKYPILLGRTAPTLGGPYTYFMMGCISIYGPTARDSPRFIRRRAYMALRVRTALVVANGDLDKVAFPPRAPSPFPPSPNLVKGGDPGWKRYLGRELPYMSTNGRYPLVVPRYGHVLCM